MFFLFSQAGVMFRYDGDGRVTRYGLGLGGTFTAAPGYFETLTQSSGTFTITTKDQTRYLHTDRRDALSGHRPSLSADADRRSNSNTTTLTYSAGNLTQVTDTYGRALTFTCNASGHLTSVKDPSAG
jgi:YD repeat-containing protein